MTPFDTETLATHRSLVARMADGDVDALRKLHAEFSPRLHGIVRRILDDPEEIREVVQDTFIKAWRQSAMYRPERGEVAPWLVFIARNAAIDRHRRHARHRRLLAAIQAEDTDVVPLVGPSDGLREDLDRGLAQLSLPQKQALELAFFGGCSQSEIAAEMRAPVGSVKTHLRRGLLKLRELLLPHD